MDALKAQRFLKRDTSRCRRSNETEIADKEHSLLEDRLALDALEFACKIQRVGTCQITCQCRGTHHRAVVKLDFVRLVCGSNLATPLQIDDGINERRFPPR